MNKLVLEDISSYETSLSEFDLAQNKKAQLQREFIKMCTKTIVSKDIESGVKNDAISEDKPDVNITCKNNSNKEIKKYRETIKQLQKENAKIKQSRYAYFLEIKSQKEEIVNLKKQLSNMEKKAEGETLKKIEMEKELKKVTSSKKNKDIKQLRQENAQLKSKLMKVANSLKSKEKQIQNYQLVRSGELESNVLSKHKLLIQEKNNEIINLKRKYVNSLATINKLNEKLLKKNQGFIIKKTEESLNKVDSSINSVGKENIKAKNIKFGYISLNKDGDVVFVDIQTRRYILSKKNDTDKLLKYIGFPARAVITGNKLAKVDYIYYNLCSSSTSKINKMKKISAVKKNIEPREKELLGTNVLILASRYKDKYVSELTYKGCNVTWVDCFSDSIGKIRTISKSIDVVIVCTSHVPHSVIYTLKNIPDFNEANPKYQLIENDNVNSIVARIKYSLENAKTY